MPDRTQFVPNAPVQDQIDDLRKGTFQKYESEWTLIESTGNHVFTHNLDEIPCAVDVIRSELNTGDNPRSADSGVTPGQELTVAKTDTTITVTNNVTTSINTFKNFYFKVRAF